MWAKKSFVRSKRRGSEALAVQAILAVLLIGGGVFGVATYVHMSSQATSASTGSAYVNPDEEMVEIIVPIDTIETGSALEPSMFRRDRRIASAINQDILRDVEEVRGQFAKGLLVKSQPIHRDYLTTLQPVNRLTASIPIGYRAIALSVDATSSVEGWAQAGARVDVLWISGFTGEQVATVVAENAKVLSANRQTEGGNRSSDPREKRKEKEKKEEGGIPATVTVLLSNRDSLKVRLATLNGRIALILRGDDSGRSPMIGSIGVNSLYNQNTQQVSIPKNITAVKVKDKDGSEHTMLFENGRRLRN